MNRDLKDVFKKGFNDDGRPKIVETKEELIEGINSYYNSILVEPDDKSEKPYFHRPTITGLAIHLGYASRQSIYDNQKNEEFSYILKKATIFIEEYHEESLSSKNVTGHIFALKNMGWSDKKEIETTLKDEAKPDFSKLSTEELIEYQKINEKLEN